MCNGVCQDCKYWIRKVDFAVMLAQRNRETPPESKENSGECLHPTFVYTGDSYPKHTPENGLSYFDAEGYGAGFETGQNFGCIHFETKD